VEEGWIFDRRCTLDTYYRVRSPGDGREVETASPWRNKGTTDLLLPRPHFLRCW
jgi:hypothetical protein